MFQDAPVYSLSASRQTLLLGIVLTSSNLALSIIWNSRVYLFEQAQCRVYYLSHGPSQVNARHGVAESLCKLGEIQYPLSITVGIDSCLAVLPGKAKIFPSCSPCP